MGERVSQQMYPKLFDAAGLVIKVQADEADTAQAGVPFGGGVLDYAPVFYRY